MDTQLNLIDLPAGPEAPGSGASNSDGPQLTRRVKPANRGTPRRDRANPPARDPGADTADGADGADTPTGSDGGEPRARSRHKAPRPRTPKGERPRTPDAGTPFRLPDNVRATGRQGIASARRAIAAARQRAVAEGDTADQQQRPSAA